jgi:RNA polymerase sigma-70 factor (ECF subfamily)
VISIDDDSVENRYRQEPSDNSTPEKIFERSWALTLIQTVFEKMKKHYAEIGKMDLFDAIEGNLFDDDLADTYAEIAKKLNMTEGAVKMSVLRMRRNLSFRLRFEVGRTLCDPAEIDDEIRGLFASLRG